MKLYIFIENSLLTYLFDAFATDVYTYLLLNQYSLNGFMYSLFIQYFWYGLVHILRRINTSSIGLYTCSYWTNTFAINSYIDLSDNRYLLHWFVYIFWLIQYFCYGIEHTCEIKKYMIALYICSYVFNTVAMDLYVFVNRSILFVRIYIQLLIHSLLFSWDYIYIYIYVFVQ